MSWINLLRRETPASLTLLRSKLVGDQAEVDEDQERKRALGEQRSQNQFKPGSQVWHQEAPMVADALRRGTLLTVTATSGAESRGYVCDRDGHGLLLDLHDGPGYRFYPWSSVEHITIEEARHLRPGEAGPAE